MTTPDEASGALPYCYGDDGDDDSLPALSEDNLIDQTLKSLGGSFSAADQHTPPEQIGVYTILHKIAEGGMGAVYLAEQQQPFRRQVAIKVIKSGANSRRIVKRFESERQALAMMNHQNIAKIFDAGTTADNAPFFAMELVEGIPLTDYCDRNKLSINERLELFIQVCLAIQHAHQKGIIHRDLKPSNVLVATVDDRPVPKVIDFGLAKATELATNYTDQTAFTEFGKIVGTLQYMSPEQAGSDSKDVDTRTDIYSLGVMLYELLTGSTPLDNQTVAQQAFLTVLEIIRDREPPRPSTRLSNSGDRLTGVSVKRNIDPRKLKQILKGELDWIVMKALDKDRERRFDSAGDFAKDLKCYLSDDPIEARPPSAVYRIRKLIHKHRRPIGIAAAFVSLLFVSLGWMAIRESNQRESQMTAEADRLVDGLLSSNTNNVPRLNDQLSRLENRGHRRLSMEFENQADGSDGKLHAAMALANTSESAADYLWNQLLKIDADQFQPVCQFINEPSTSKLEQFAAIGLNKDYPDQARFQALSGLATFSPDHACWDDESVQEFAAQRLVNVWPSALQHWGAVLRPVLPKMEPHLQAILASEDTSDQQKTFATETLAAYFAADRTKGSVAKLFELCLNLEPACFEVAFGRLKEHQSQAGKQAEELVRNAAYTAQGNLERHAKRVSNAAIILARLDQADSIWALLRDSDDRRTRSYLVDKFARLHVSPALLVQRLSEESDPFVKSAIILGLGRYKLSALKSAQTETINRLLAAHADHPDNYVHSATAWALRGWGREPEAVSKEYQVVRAAGYKSMGNGFPNGKRWQVNSIGQTEILFEATEFPMGSPENETGRQPIEQQHTRSINRLLAMSSTEVTKRQFKAFTDQPGIRPISREKAFHSTTLDSPMLGVPWYEAARFCNWLSQREGIPKHQWCYEPNSDGEYGPGMKAKDNFWELTGYRLPTESEWEFAARAGARTSRHFGETDSLLKSYAWYGANSKRNSHPAGHLLPNEFGLFDMLGNAYEWCNDLYLDDYPKTENGKKSVADKIKPKILYNKDFRVLRGGSFLDRSSTVRSSDRNISFPQEYNHVTGFRTARTIIAE